MSTMSDELKRPEAVADLESFVAETHDYRISAAALRKEAAKWLEYIRALEAVGSDTPAPATDDVDALVSAYRTGAKDVHDFLAKLPDDERQMVLRDDCPDLTEAAHTYARAALEQGK